MGHAPTGQKTPFVPTDADRRFVSAMAGIRMSYDEMCSVIHNPSTNRPINKRTLMKAFKSELANGVAALRAKISKRFLDMLDSADDRVALRAVEFGARFALGWKDDGTVVNVAAINTGGDKIPDKPFEISFRMPDGRLTQLDLDDEEIDDADWSRRPVSRPAPLQIEHNKPYQHDSRRLSEEGREGEERAARTAPSRARGRGRTIEREAQVVIPRPEVDATALDRMAQHVSVFGPPPRKPGGWLK
jgi:hypothetical protein